MPCVCFVCLCRPLSPLPFGALNESSFPPPPPLLFTYLLCRRLIQYCAHSPEPSSSFSLSSPLLLAFKWPVWLAGWLVLRSFQLNEHHWRRAREKKRRSTADPVTGQLTQHQPKTCIFSGRQTNKQTNTDRLWGRKRGKKS